MSWREQLTELSLSLVLSERTAARTADAKPMLGKDQALCELRDSLQRLSSFIDVRVVSDRQSVERSFSVVFQILETLRDGTPEERDTIGDLRASIGHWLAFRRAAGPLDERSNPSTGTLKRSKLSSTASEPSPAAS